jgi:hypothetical protein
MSLSRILESAAEQAWTPPSGPISVVSLETVNGLIREAYQRGIQDYEGEWYRKEHVEGERPYGFEIAGITAFLLERSKDA